MSPRWVSKKVNFPLNHTELGERIRSQELNLLVFPTLCPKKNPCWIMLNIKLQHHPCWIILLDPDVNMIQHDLNQQKSRILFYVHASMPPLRKPKQKMAARMNVWKMMMFHHEILNWKREVHCLSFWPFMVFISFHFGGLDLHFLSDVKRTFCWEMFSCFFEVDQRRSC